MVPIWVCIVVLTIGLAVGAVLTYLFATGRLGRRYASDLLRASVEATREKALREAQEQLFDHIHPEIQYFVTNEKQFFVKRTRLVIRERLLYRHVPLMGGVEHSHLVSEHMDTAQLEEFAMAAARLIEAGDAQAATIKRIAS